MQKKEDEKKEEGGKSKKQMLKKEVRTAAAFNYLDGSCSVIDSKGNEVINDQAECVAASTGYETAKLPTSTMVLRGDAVKHISTPAQ